MARAEEIAMVEDIKRAAAPPQAAITQVNFVAPGVYAGVGSSSLITMASEKDGWHFEDRGEWLRFWNTRNPESVYEVPREMVMLRKIRVGK